MKHIKRKFLFHDRLAKMDFESQPGFELYDPKQMDQDMLKKAGKDRISILQTESGENVFSFIFNNQGTRTIIPIPDFTLVNYNWAYKMNLSRKEAHKKLVENLKDLTNPNETSNTYAYDFQGCSSTCVIMLFSSIECFINESIKSDFIYSVDTGRKTESYNKSQIEKYIPFSDKLKKVLPQIYKGKDFFQHSTKATTHINLLKELRDDIVHVKSDDTGESNVDILKRLLLFNYDAAFDSVFKMFNYYRDGFIEECPCSENW